MMFRIVFIWVFALLSVLIWWSLRMEDTMVHRHDRSIDDRSRCASGSGR